MKTVLRLSNIGLILAAFAGSLSSAQEIHVKKPAVVVVTLFPGEWQHWHELLLKEELPFPAGASGVPLGWNEEMKVLGLVTGEASKNTAQSITALGMDPRFDLRESVWMLAGIAGFDPLQLPLGSVVMGHHLVDGDQARYIDPREIAKNWTTGWLPPNRSEPFGVPAPSANEAWKAGVAYTLSEPLLEWAHERTKNIKLDPLTEMQRVISAPYAAAYPKTTEDPQIIIGDTLSTDFFWAGELTTEWARTWMKYWTQGRATFSNCAMEDIAVAQSLAGLHRIGRVRDPFEAYLVLRSASNFVMPPPGVAPGDFDGSFVPDPAFKNVYNVGLEIIKGIVAGEAPLDGKAKAAQGESTLTIWA